MVSQDVCVDFKIGIHSRPAVLLIQKMKEYPDTAFSFTRDGKKVNGRSLTGLLSLGITEGCTINLAADGGKEDEALQELIRMIREVLPSEK